MAVQLTTPLTITAQDAEHIAQQFVLAHLGDQIGTGLAWRVVSPLRAAWIVPLVLTSPGYSVVGTVGGLIIDEELGVVVAWTPNEEIEANAAQLAHQHHDAIQAAWKKVQVSVPQ